MSSSRQRVVFVGGQATPPTDLDASFDVLTPRTQRAAVDRVDRDSVDCVVVTDGTDDPLETIAAVRSAAPSTPLIYATAEPDGAAAAAATRAGVTEYFAGVGEASLADRVAALATGSAVGPDGDLRGANADGEKRTEDDRSPEHERLEERERALQRAYEAVTASDRSFDDRLESLLGVVRRTLGTEYATLSRVDADTGDYLLEALDAPPEAPLEAGETVPLAATNCERVVSTEETLVLEDIERDAPELADRASNAELGFSCYLGAPVIVDGEVYGTFCFYDTDARATPFTDWDVTFVELLGDWVSAELERRRYERDLEAANERLEEARTSLERTFERIDDAVFALDESWNFTFLNERAEALIAADGEDLLGTNVWDAFPEAVGMTFGERYRHAMAEQEPVAFEEYFPPLERWFEVRAYPSETGLSVYFTDITERRERNVELRQYETIVETIDDGVLVIDSDQRVARVNDAYATLVGEDRSTLLGSHASRFVDDETWLEWMDHVMSLSTGETDRATLETELQRADGTSVPIEANVTLLQEGDANDIGFVCVVRDVTERARREEIVTQLLETTRQLVTCESHATIAETIVDAAERAFGYPFVAVRRYDPDDETLSLAAATGGVETALGVRERIPVGQGPVGTAFERSEPVVVGDTQREGTVAFEHASDDSPLRAIMCIPIGDVGVLSIGSTTPDAFDDGDRRLAQLLSSSAAVALERADRREALVRYERVLESVEGMVYAIDEAGRFTLVTELLADRAGYDREELLGAHVGRILAPESVERGQRHIRELLDDPRRDSTAFEATATAADGERFPVEIECSLLPADDGFGGTVGAVRDITERKEREQYLQVLNRVLRHNLRNDLTVVIGYAELLREAVDEDGLAPMVATLHETATDLARTSEKARAIHHALGRDHDPEPIDVAALIADAVEAVESDDAVDTAGATIRVTAPDTCWARADDSLALVVENLLENAVRYAGPEPTVDVSVTAVDDRVAIAVADDGPGIPNAEIDVVTGDSAITQLTHSSGLGLWLVRWIADALGGTITFDEGPLNGSEVTVALPRDPAADESAAERSLEAADPESNADGIDGRN